MGGLFSADAWLKVWIFRDVFIIGLKNTLITASFSLILALFLGVIFGLMSTSDNKFSKIISRIYVELIQNTPVILQMCFLYYALSFSGNSIGIIPTGIVTLGVYHGAYISEVMRAGIEAIPKGQNEAALSQGFNYVQRMCYIILPQSIKVILPPLVNQIVNLIKNTSCLYIVGGADLISSTYNFVTGATTGGAYGPAYILCGVIFFAICFPLSVLSSKWETALKQRESRNSNTKNDGKAVA